MAHLLDGSFVGWLICWMAHLLDGYLLALRHPSRCGRRGHVSHTVPISLERPSSFPNYFHSKKNSLWNSSRQMMNKLRLTYNKAERPGTIGGAVGI
jgi:hypothetical protein